jgi:hypothetical protein
MGLKQAFIGRQKSTTPPKRQHEESWNFAEVSCIRLAISFGPIDLTFSPKSLEEFCGPDLHQRHAEEKYKVKMREDACAKQ